jgi:3-hydroxy acid dehydrogenase / malonic semialdehyde reductase
MQKTVLITGASSGIGYATALYLATQGFSIIACGRRKERLDELAVRCTAMGAKCYPLLFDVRDQHAVATAIGSLPENWQHIDVLINNAGNAHGLSAIQDGNIEDWNAMIDINVKGLLHVSHAIIPGMVDRKKGHIVNIGSIAGKEVYPNGNIYCASKFAVDAINQGMRMDLHSHNIRVSAINPGLVETEFSEVRFKGDKDRAAKVYQGYQPLQAQDIAELIHFIITRPAHVNIADTLVLPTDQASSTIVNKKPN